MATKEKNMSDIVGRVTYPASLTLAAKETIKNSFCEEHSMEKPSIIQLSSVFSGYEFVLYKMVSICNSCVMWRKSSMTAYQSLPCFHLQSVTSEPHKKHFIKMTYFTVACLRPDSKKWLFMIAATV